MKTARMVCLAVPTCAAALIAAPQRDRQAHTPPAVHPAQAATAAIPAATEPVAGPVPALLEQYCVSCHSNRLRAAGLTLEDLDVSEPGDDAARWEKVVLKLRSREMPPRGLRRPDEAAYETAASWLEQRLDDAATTRPFPGRVPVHRLNRTEYANVVRDVLGVEIDGSTSLPADVPDRQGFDNTASVLSVSPALLENYLSTAFMVSRLAVGDLRDERTVTYTLSANLNQDEWMGPALPFGSRGGVAIRHHFPVDGVYTIRVRLRRQLYEYILGMGETHQVDIRLDGRRLHRSSVGGKAKGMTTPENFPGDTQADPEWEVYMHTADAGLEVTLPVEAGSREITVTFVRAHWEPEGILQPPQIDSFARTDNELYFGHPGVGAILVTGPTSPAGPRRPERGRDKVFSCIPRSTREEEPCARKILVALAGRAYRRPPTDEESSTLLSFYRDGRAEGDFVEGVRRGIERILAAPSFLFRVERMPDGVSGAYPLSDLDLASRLSFFLWSSVPDGPLLELASRQRLREPAVLRAQVRRMLADPRSRSIADSFAMQWLKMDVLKGFVPDPFTFPEWDDNLRDAMQEETRLFVADQLARDRGVFELLTGDYTFMNERLARHYDVPHVYGAHFRRVTVDEGARGGLLGHASILTSTSYPDRTSPVLRGKWLLDNILGSPIPVPPPDVPALVETRGDGRPISIREQMQAHRSSPVCATCHQRMDPLGLSLEHYDPIGRWRAISDGQAVDASGTMADGTRFEGLTGLRQYLARHRQDFVRAVVEKLLSYALGRGTGPHDQPVIRRIMRDAGADGHRWSSIIQGVVTSVPFTMGHQDADSARVAHSTPARIDDRRVAGSGSRNP